MGHPGKLLLWLRTPRHEMKLWLKPYRLSGICRGFCMIPDICWVMRNGCLPSTYHSCSQLITCHICFTHVSFLFSSHTSRFCLASARMILEKHGEKYCHQGVAISWKASKQPYSAHPKTWRFNRLNCKILHPDGDHATTLALGGALCLTHE